MFLMSHVLRDHPEAAALEKRGADVRFEGV